MQRNAILAYPSLRQQLLVCHPYPASMQQHWQTSRVHLSACHFLSMLFCSAELSAAAPSSDAAASQETLQQLQAAQAELQELRAQHASAAGEAAAANSELAAVQAQLQAAAQQLSDARQQLAEAADSREALQRQLASLQDGLQEAAAEKEAAFTRLGELQWASLSAVAPVLWFDCLLQHVPHTGTAGMSYGFEELPAQGSRRKHMLR
jgi:septal ring factor EnvC (AmiA/AmiB activator)